MPYSVVLFSMFWRHLLNFCSFLFCIRLLAHRTLERESDSEQGKDSVFEVELQRSAFFHRYHWICPHMNEIDLLIFDHSFTCGLCSFFRAFVGPKPPETRALSVFIVRIWLQIYCWNRCSPNLNPSRHPKGYALYRQWRIEPNLLREFLICWHQNNGIIKSNVSFCTHFCADRKGHFFHSHHMNATMHCGSKSTRAPN